MNDSGDLAAWIELSLVSGLGGQRLRACFHLRSSNEVLKATRSQLGARARGALPRASSSEAAPPKWKKLFSMGCTARA